jgi:hypothetical protein
VGAEVRDVLATNGGIHAELLSLMEVEGR